MLRFVKNNNPFTVIVLFIFTLLIKFNVLTNPSLPVEIHNHFIYNFIIKYFLVLFKQFPFWFNFLAVINIFFQALFINYITIEHKLFQHSTYIPAYMYLVLSSIYPVFSVFNETIFLNWFLLGAINVMFGFSNTFHPRKLIFNAGFLFCLAALFQFTFIVYFLLLLVGMVMFRSFNFGEWSVAIMGFFTPVYFLFGLLFLFDNFFLINQWLHIGFSLTPVASKQIYFTITIVSLLFLLLCGTYAVQINLAISNIYIRRGWALIMFYLIISVLAAFFTDDTIKSAWLIAIPALSIIVSNALVLEKKKRFSNTIFYFSLLFVLFCLWANKI